MSRHSRLLSPDLVNEDASQAPGPLLREMTRHLTTTATIIHVYHSNK